MTTILPTIHLNGTHPEELMRQAQMACEPLRKAIWAMTEMAPNARDYYPQGPDAFPQAREQHLARIRKLQEVLQELYGIQDHLADAIDERKERQNR